MESVEVRCIRESIQAPKPQAQIPYITLCVVFHSEAVYMYLCVFSLVHRPS